MCGVMAIIRKRGNVATELINGLNQLQHRGQDAAGIVSVDRSTGQFHCAKDRGLVSQVFHHANLEELTGEWAIGHVRYATSGSGGKREVQPTTAVMGRRQVSLSYNGHIVNYPQLRDRLKEERHFLSDSDVEVLLHVFCQNASLEEDAFESLIHGVSKIYEQVAGAYSVVGVIQGRGVFAFRDPRGIRPLLLARDPEGEGFAFCSETYPLTFLGYEQIEDVKPGEVVFIDEDGQIHRRQICKQSCRHCSFEYVYFAKANAQLEGFDVYRTRSNLGLAIGRKVKRLGLDVDVVMGVPATSQPAAMAAAWELGVRLEEGFLRKDHSGRSFILPTQEGRKQAVSQKLAPVSCVFEGKRVLIVDDSIVRGTVSKTIVAIARNCGAKEVYFASTFPPIRYPCFYGIDIYASDQLLAYEKDYEEIAREIDADAVIYNDLEDLQKAIGTAELCHACVNGKYPTDICDAKNMQELRREGICEREQKEQCTPATV